MPTSASPTNKDRANAAKLALEAFRTTNFPEGSTNQGYDDASPDDKAILEQDIKDLIADLMHLARRECNSDLQNLLASATMHHDAETEEEEEE